MGTEQDKQAGALAPRLLKHLLPVGLVVAVAVAMLVPGPGRTLNDYKAMRWLTVVLFFLTGLRFQSHQARATLGAWHAVLTAVPVSLLVAPVLGVLLGRLVGLEQALLVGFIVVSCVPPTLSSGVIITGVARGNTMLATLLTIILNGLGVLLVPKSVALGLDVGTQLSIDPWQLLAKLALLVLLPFFVALVIRPWVLRKLGRPSSVFPNLVVIAMVWIATSGGRDKLLGIPPGTFALLAGLCLALHCTLLVVNYTAGRLQKLPLPELKALVFVASQKTLPVSLAVLGMLASSDQFDDALVEAAAVSCIMFHMLQLLLDSILATRWKDATEPAD